MNGRPAPPATGTSAVPVPAARVDQSPASGVTQRGAAPLSADTAPTIIREVESAPARSAPAAPAPVLAAASLEDVVSRVMPAVVLVETPAGRGSGFFVSLDTLLTNVHVVGSSSSVTIRRMSGATLSARVAAVSPRFDIAVLKVSVPEPNQATIALGSASNARVGQEVIAIGSALGTLQNTVTRGIVSAVRQSGSLTLVQTDAAINPGNSGGPLLDRTGTAIGITTMGYAERQGLNFAVAIDHAQTLLEGRTPAAPEAGSPAADLRSLSPAVVSEAERARAAGTRTYEQTLVQLARRAEGLDDYWRRFRASCYEGRVTGSFDREWYAIFDQRAMQGAVAPGCGNSFADIRRLATDIRDAVIAAEEAARQADVYPGTRRDARRKYRLDYAGWDR